MNLCHIKSLTNVIHIDLLYIKSYKLLLHKISTNINRDFFLDYYPHFGVRMCESRSHVYIYYRRVRSSIGGCFQVGSFFSGLTSLQNNFYQNKLQNLFLIILPNYVFVAYLLPTILLFKLYQYIVTF